MRRRSKAGDQVKKQHRKTMTLKRRYPPKSGRRRSSSAGKETEVARFIRELHEAQEQQTATADVLKIISASRTELQPILDVVVRSAARYCKADDVTLFELDGQDLREAAHWGALRHGGGSFRFPCTRGSVAGRVVLERKPVHVIDLQAEAENFPEGSALARRFGHRTIASVPLLSEGVAVGTVQIRRTEVNPFTDKQIALLETFAAQAVIAIENMRLLNELRHRTVDLTESLEQQTATSDVFKLISSPQASVQAVLDSVAANAVRLCEALHATIYLRDGEFLVIHAHSGPLGRTPIGTRQVPNNKWVGGRAVLEGRTIHVPDLQSDDDYPEGKEIALRLGHRTTLAVPLICNETAIGAILLRRREARPYNDRQIALVQNFAAQAVIAIENARLLSELRESLEQQTATADVLRVISSSPGELEPVFRPMLEKAVRLCDATFGFLHLYEDGKFITGATRYNPPPAFAEDVVKRGQLHPGPLHPLVRMRETKQLLHIYDYAEDPAYKQGDPMAVRLVELAGARTLIEVPMLKEGELIGAIAIYRQEVRPFTDKQIALVQNFAAQAVIAIENARLLHELRQRTAEVVKLNQQLEQRVADQVGEIERMGRLRRFLPPQVADLIVASGTEKQLESHRREITALFCDLRGFTGFSESSDPEDVMALLAEYHAAIGTIINKYSGTLERYAGDGVMVIFNDPVPVENPALQAVLMALDMRAAIGGLIEKWRDLGHDLGFGIGIAHGFATLGTIGFEGRRDYAAIGTVSNVASRLCDEAKPGQILIAPRVRQAVEKSVIIEPIGEFTLKGIRRPMLTYNVLEPLPSKPN
jgi:class 3 adenylate cyclase/putative methionine-R-sulfoxide reductase with GAF domain